MNESDSEKAVRIAREILEGSKPVFLGCKQLLGPLNRLGVHHEKPFVTITGVESELDEFPIWPDERPLWNQQVVAEKDAQLAKWLPQIQEHVFAACRAVIERFGMRDEIRAIAALGIMPAHWNADAQTIERWGRAVEAIQAPVTDDEAVALMSALPRDEDDLFGLAWILLHACETAPGHSSALVLRSRVTGEWRERLLNRLRDAGH